MLWQVERIMLERPKAKLALPKFLLMENVSNILSDSHRNNVEEWKGILEGMGYVNVVYTLNSKDFGSPQSRKRVYMLSIQCNNNEAQILDVIDYIDNNNLENEGYVNTLNIKSKSIRDVLRVKYDSNDNYITEANEI